MLSKTLISNNEYRNILNSVSPALPRTGEVLRSAEPARERRPRDSDRCRERLLRLAFEFSIIEALSTKAKGRDKWRQLPSVGDKSMNLYYHRRAEIRLQTRQEDKAS
ncbi:Hypp233 [Branchiostoma lanceolatum]|uniref:Hypp233 protein n=1 Tax=Branchiostoma lanceolatum TaxID=7740 RepID=A0A8J9V950_BRALA|nr:Hypp233 [Branchiostoma lanceolatum]